MLREKKDIPYIGMLSYFPESIGPLLDVRVCLKDRGKLARLEKGHFSGQVATVLYQQYEHFRRRIIERRL